MFSISRKDADGPISGTASAKPTLTDGGTGTVAGSGALNNSSTSEPSTKCIRTGKQYACSQCSYSADKKVSLNRHMRMHQTSPTPSSVTSNGGDDCSSQVFSQNGPSPPNYFPC